MPDGERRAERRFTRLWHRVAWFTRRWPARRVALAAVAGLLLLSAAVLGGQGPVGAQEAEGEAEPKSLADVRISGLSGTLTHGGRDGFTVTASNLTTVVGYDVIVSRNNASLGIGACGTSSQTQRVSGVTSQNLSFTVHGCAAGSGTVTAVVRRTGLTTNEDAASQAVTVRARAPAAPARPTAPNPQAREFTARWQAPGDTGGTALTGYHVLMRPNGASWPPDSEGDQGRREHAQPSIQRVDAESDLLVQGQGLQRGQPDALLGLVAAGLGDAADRHAGNADVARL